MEEDLEISGDKEGVEGGRVNLLPPGGYLRNGSRWPLRGQSPFSQEKVSTCLAQGQRDMFCKICKTETFFALFFFKRSTKVI